MSSDFGERLESTVVAEWYAAHAVAVRAFLLGILRNQELTQEALQATFTKLIEQGHTTQQETRKGWLFRVAYHEAMLLRRRQGVQARALVKLAEFLPSEKSRDEESRPDDPLQRQELIQQIQTLLLTLPAEQQTVVRMRIYDDKTFAQIAAELGLPLGTVLTRMRLALKKLGDQFPDPS